MKTLSTSVTLTKKLDVDISLANEQVVNSIINHGIARIIYVVEGNEMDQTTGSRKLVILNESIEYAASCKKAYMDNPTPDLSDLQIVIVNNQEAYEEQSDTKEVVEPKEVVGPRIGLKKDGSAFATIRAAKAGATKNNFKGARIIEIMCGYAYVPYYNGTPA